MKSPQNPENASLLPKAYHVIANDRPPTPFSRIIGRSRYIVLLAVISVLLVAVALFLIGVVQAGTGIWSAIQTVVSGGLADKEVDATALTISFLEIVGTMLKAVVFYIIGVGLYSLFIAPLNLSMSLGVETLNDLEDKIISVVIVILAVTFLEHFVRWDAPLATLEYGGALALVVSALVFFQRHSHQAKTAQQDKAPDVTARAKKELFEEDNEQHVISENELEGETQSSGDG